MPSKVYEVVRVLSSRSGDLLIPTTAFEDAAAAARVADELAPKLKVLVTCRLIRQTGPDRGTDMGLSLGEFLAQLGIVGINDIVREIEIASSSIIAPPPGPRLIVPS